MATVKGIHPQFVIDDQGKARSVVLSIEEFDALMELVEDANDAEALDLAVESSTELRDFSAVLADLKRDGLL